MHEELRNGRKLRVVEDIYEYRVVRCAVGVTDGFKIEVSLL